MVPCHVETNRGQMSSKSLPSLFLDTAQMMRDTRTCFATVLSRRSGLVYEHSRYASAIRTRRRQEPARSGPTRRVIIARINRPRGVCLPLGHALAGCSVRRSRGIHPAEARTHRGRTRDPACQRGCRRGCDRSRATRPWSHRLH